MRKLTVAIALLLTICLVGCPCKIIEKIEYVEIEPSDPEPDNPEPDDPEPEDTMSPTVISTYPANNDTDVPINTTVSIDFSEVIDKNTQLQGAPYFWEDNTLLLYLSLEYGYTYIITVEGLTDLVGNLIVPYEFSFTVEDEPIITDPLVSALLSTWYDNTTFPIYTVDGYPNVYTYIDGIELVIESATMTFTWEDNIASGEWWLTNGYICFNIQNTSLSNNVTLAQFFGSDDSVHLFMYDLIDDNTLVIWVQTSNDWYVGYKTYTLIKQ